jgi:hypothetical protein
VAALLSTTGCAGAVPTVRRHCDVLEGEAACVQPLEPATNVASPPSAVGKEEGWRERAEEEVEE